MDDVKVQPRPGRVESDLAFIIKNTEREYYPFDDTSMHEDALCYQATTPEHLYEMAEYLGLDGTDIFVDLGCGKGRVVCLMALQHVRKVIGVELRKELADKALENVRFLNPSVPVEIINEDCAVFRDNTATIFYMFNAFGQNTVRSVLDNIKESLEENPRNVRIVYNNGVFSQMLDESSWLRKEGRIGSTGMLVWSVCYDK